MTNIKTYLNDLLAAPVGFSAVPSELRTNPEFIKALLCRPFDAYIEFEKPLQEKAVKSIFSCLSVFNYVPQTIQNDLGLIKDCIPLCSGYLYRYLQTSVKNDAALFLMAARHASKAYVWQMANEYLTKKGLSHYQLFDAGSFNAFLETQSLLAPEDDEKTLPFMANKSVVLEALEYQPQLFTRLNSILKNDVEVARAAVSRFYVMYKDAGSAAKDDADLAIEYVISEASYYQDSDEFLGIYWEEISARLRNSKDFYLRLLHQCKKAIAENAVKGSIANVLLKDILNLAPEAIANNTELKIK
ncbi:MAG: hypothetical protein ACK5FT_06275 [Sphingomonadales bacterium]|jgi:hypothetical protein